MFLGFLVTFHMAAVCVLHPLNIENTMTFIVVRTIHNVLAMRLDPPAFCDFGERYVLVRELDL